MCTTAKGNVKNAKSSAGNTGKATWDDYNNILISAMPGRTVTLYRYPTWSWTRQPREAEYSFSLHADGTVDFTLSGTPVLGLTRRVNGQTRSSIISAPARYA